MSGSITVRRSAPPLARPVGRWSWIGAGLLATLLGYAAWAKLVDGTVSEAVSSRLELVHRALPWFPEALAAVSIAVAIAEAVVAVLLLWPKARHFGALATVGLGGAWCFALAHFEALGLAPATCGCLGAEVTMSYPIHYMLNGTVVLVALGVLSAEDRSA